MSDSESSSTTSETFALCEHILARYFNAPEEIFSRLCVDASIPRKSLDRVLENENALRFFKVALDIGIIEATGSKTYRLNRMRVLCLPLLRNFRVHSERSYMFNGSLQLLEIVLEKLLGGDSDREKQDFESYFRARILQLSKAKLTDRKRNCAFMREYLNTKEDKKHDLITERFNTLWNYLKDNDLIVLESNNVSRDLSEISEPPPKRRKLVKKSAWRMCIKGILELNLAQNIVTSVFGDLSPAHIAILRAMTKSPSSWRGLHDIKTEVQKYVGIVNMKEMYCRLEELCQYTNYMRRKEGPLYQLDMDQLQHSMKLETIVEGILSLNQGLNDGCSLAMAQIFRVLSRQNLLEIKLVYQETLLPKEVCDRALEVLRRQNWISIKRYKTSEHVDGQQRVLILGSVNWEASYDQIQQMILHVLGTFFERQKTIVSRLKSLLPKIKECEQSAQAYFRAQQVSEKLEKNATIFTRKLLLLSGE